MTRSKRRSSYSKFGKNLATLGVEEQLLTVEQFDKFVSDDMAATLTLAKSAHLEPKD